MAKPASKIKTSPKSHKKLAIIVVAVIVAIGAAVSIATFANSNYPTKCTGNPSVSGCLTQNELCQLDQTRWKNAYMQCDAATAFTKMADAFQAKFGVVLTTSSQNGKPGNNSGGDFYRSLPEQVSCRQRKGNVCATPGKSNHGWGLAIDIDNSRFPRGSEQNFWMWDHRCMFGFHNPFYQPLAYEYNKPNGKNEAWHFEYNPLRCLDQNFYPAGSGNPTTEPLNQTATTTPTGTPIPPATPPTSETPVK